LRVIKKKEKKKTGPAYRNEEDELKGLPLESNIKKKWTNQEYRDTGILGPRKNQFS